MALPARRSYAGAAEACTLTSNISNSATSFSITGTTTAWPSTATGPFYMVIDPGLSTEEKVLVGARTTGSLSSVTRGVDGTSAAAHDSGATCYPVLAAVDLNEANLLASTLTTKGDLLSTDGSDPKRVAVGSNNTRLVADSAQTAGIKWVADTQNTVIDAKGDLLVGSAADTIARLAVGTDNQMIVAASGETTGLKYVGGGAWTSFTPTWKIGANTMSTTGIDYGYYTIINNVVIIKMGVRVNTYAGAGTLSVTVPSGAGIASDSSYHRCGYGELSDVSASLGYALSVYADTTSTTVFQCLATHPGWTVNDSSPVNFITTADEIWVTIIGRKA